MQSTNVRPGQPGPGDLASAQDQFIVDSEALVQVHLPGLTFDINKSCDAAKSNHVVSRKLNRGSGPGAAFYALGRLPAGTMNKTEAAYAAHLALLKAAGEIAGYWFEAVKFRLADRTHYEPDFLVLRADGVLEAHEVKGARAVFQDDARVKLKLAAATFPLRFLAVYPQSKRAGGAWDVEAFS